MTELPHPWGAYLRLQTQLDKNTRIDDRNWGLEAGLDAIVAAAGQPTNLKEEDVARAVSSAARQERNRVLIRLKHLPREESKFDPAPTLDARAQLHLIHSAVTASEWKLLVDVARGHRYAELGPAPRLRVRLARLREELAKVA